jgi:hypothetical protein
MQVIGPNDHGLDGERSALAGRHARRPQIVNGVGQEFPAAFQKRDRKQERAFRNKGAPVLGQDFSLTEWLKAGCASLSRPMAMA